MQTGMQQSQSSASSTPTQQISKRAPCGTNLQPDCDRSSRNYNVGGIDKIDKF